ncbi:MAG: PAS domain S-box protein [Deltaproteobacteria bacterium]|nr:PAS domain S-box protein [Deltaproteobacteria bacterium]
MSDEKPTTTDLEQQIVVLRQQLEQARDTNVDLERRNQAAEQLVDTAHVLVVVLDTWGRIVRVNPFFEELTGYSSKEIEGESWFDTFLPVPDRARIRAVFAKAVVEGRVHGNLNPIVARDGTEIPIEWYATTLYDRDGEPMGVLSVGADVSERTRAKSALEESEQRSKIIFETAVDGILVVKSRTLEIVEANESMCRMLGYTRSQLHGLNVSDIHTEQALPQVLAEFENLLREKRTIAENIPVKRRDGRTFTADISTTPLTLDGQPCVACIFRDTTERKRSEDRVLRAQKDWEDIFQAIGHPTVILNPEREIMAANRATAAKTGLAEHDLIGRKCHEVFHGSDAAPDRCPLAGIAESLETATTDMELETLGGQYLISCTPVSDDAGHLRRIIHIATDITERKLAEDALRESEARFRGTFEQAAVGIALAKPDGPFVRINQRFCDIVGYSPDEMLSMSYMDVTHPDDRESTKIFVEQAVSGEIERPQMEKRYIRKDGSLVWINLTLSHVRDENGELIYAIGIVEDISARKHAEELSTELEAQLRQSQKMEAIGQLAGGVAHDFNNLLSPIMIYSDLLLNEISSKDPRHVEIEQIRIAAAKAKDLTQQLLAFGRKQVLSMKILDLNQVVSDLTRMLGRTLRENIDIELHLADAPLPFEGDLSQIEQIVMNLAINARDAMPGGGTMSIATRETMLDESAARELGDVLPGHYAKLTLSDTGHGMDDMTTRRVFEPFFSTKDRDKGTGLGLSTVYGIVKQHRGVIRVESAHEKGTKFEVYLPLRAPETLSSSPAAIHGEIVGGNETLLFVEDDEAVRTTTCRLLVHLGYRVLSAVDGPQALALAEAHDGSIDLLVTDVIMPKMNGPELYKNLLGLLSDLPVLFVSGYTGEAIAEQGVLEPGIDYLPKPFTVAEISTRLREILDR